MAGDESFNPYASPHAVEEPGDGLSASQAEPGSVRRQMMMWTLAVLANVPVPLTFALNETTVAGKFGITAAVLVFLLVGSALAWQNSRICKILTRGCLVVSLTQLFPILQVIAGAIALEVVKRVGLGDPLRDEFGNSDDLAFAGAMLASLLVGTAIAVVGGFVGLLIAAINWSEWWPSAEPKSASDA